jgi:hypothetical protein
LRYVAGWSRHDGVKEYSSSFPSSSFSFFCLMLNDPISVGVSGDVTSHMAKTPSLSMENKRLSTM